MKQLFFLLALTLTGCFVDSTDQSTVRLGLNLQPLGSCTRDAQGVLHLAECGAFVALTLTGDGNTLAKDEGPGDKTFLFSVPPGDDRELTLDAWRVQTRLDGTLEVLWYSAQDTFDCPPGETISRTIDVTPLATETVHFEFPPTVEDPSTVRIALLQIRHAIDIPVEGTSVALAPNEYYEAALLNPQGHIVAQSNSFFPAFDHTVVLNPL